MTGNFDINKELLDAMRIIARQEIERCNRDITKTARVIAANADETVKIEMDGKQYDNIPNYNGTTLSVNNIVKVTYPQGQASNMYVSGGGEDEITNLDQVYGLGIAIPAGEDLNNYTTPGSYYSVNTANTATLSNLPDGVTSGFRLEVKASTGAGWNKQIMYPNGSVQRIWMRQQGGGWTSWDSMITNADYEIKQITNSYGIILTLAKFGSDDHPKVIKIQGYINQTLSAGTEYTIATDTAMKSSINWYHNIFTGVKGRDTICYLKIDNNGNLLLTPHTTINSGTGMNIMECYV